MERRPVESIEYKVRRRIDRDAPTHLPLHEPAQVLGVGFLELPRQSLQPHSEVPIRSRQGLVGLGRQGGEGRLGDRDFGRGGEGTEALGGVKALR
ncbi:hypothetical protein B296_00025494 [Ensete ventricosum]|uniref:Uncharacterized protein n=1 Tax=Ensete ventricosum TaxID=4639 RepID=A0A426YSD2_ENSVE|nr:hypothetical protein B296_00025494 [Ensete ventricosum]